MQQHIKIYLAIFDDLRQEFSHLHDLFEEIYSYPKDAGVKNFVENTRKLIRQYPQVQTRLLELYKDYEYERSSNTQLPGQRNSIDSYDEYECPISGCTVTDFPHSVRELPLYCTEHPNTKLVKV